jgi:hypothetical protein
VTTEQLREFIVKETAALGLDLPRARPMIGGRKH